MSSPGSRPPRMDHLLAAAGTADLIGRFGREATKQALSEALEEGRTAWRKGGPPPSEEGLLARARSLLSDGFAPPLNRVVNATGVVLHTNLGRAPLCARHLRGGAELLSGYVDLEMDLSEGGRGHRDLRLERSFQDFLGTDYGLVAVNNNAAAVLLALRALSRGRETVVSRGELVEIGGGFRIPEVMAASGAILREVGTTNRTRLEDYAGAIGSETALLLKVHPSNYRIRGFTEEVPLESLGSLGRERGIPVMMDLGSGLLAPEGTLELGDEPSVQATLAVRPDLLCFSADKLLGACQAGLLLIRPDLVGTFRKDPLLRALRVDKVRYLLLGRAVEAYRRGAWAEIPAVAALTLSASVLRRRARALLRRVERACPGKFRLAVTEQEGRAGGGTAPLHPLPSPALSLRPTEGSPERLEAFLRAGVPPVIGTVREDAMHLHLRTLLPGDLPVVVRHLKAYQPGGACP